MNQKRSYNNRRLLISLTTRLVLLPYESHGYTARESLLHMLWEMNGWLDKYVKNAPANAANPAGKMGSSK